MTHYMSSCKPHAMKFLCHYVVGGADASTNAYKAATGVSLALAVVILLAFVFVIIIVYIRDKHRGTGEEPYRSTFTEFST